MQCRLVSAVCLWLACALSASAGPEDIALQKERQREVQEETDYTVRRMQTLLRALQFYQANPAAQRQALEEMAGSLAGLSRRQMNEVLQRLDAAGRAEEAGKSQQEIVAAYGKHREILDALKDMLNRLDALQTLEQAADRFDKHARAQLTLHLAGSQNAEDRSALADPHLSFTERLLIERRVAKRPVENKKQIDDQKEMRNDVLHLYKQVVDLRPKLSEEHQLRVRNMEKVAGEQRLVEKLVQSVVKMQVEGESPERREKRLQEAFALQAQLAGHYQELARVLRLPADLLALLREARDRVDQAIQKQEAIRQQTKPEELADQAKPEPKAKTDEPTIINGPKDLADKASLEKVTAAAKEAEKLRQLAKDEAQLQFDTKETATLLKPVAQDAVANLEKAQEAMKKAKDALARSDAKEAVAPEEKAKADLVAARKDLDKLLDKLEKEKTDPLTALEKTAEKLDQLIKEQKATREMTEKVAREKANTKAAQATQKQKELAKETAELKNEPLPSRDKIEPAIYNEEK
jgi:hypothetical protein